MINENNEEKIIELYKEGFSLTKIGKELSIDRHVISDFLTKKVFMRRKVALLIVQNIRKMKTFSKL